MKVFQVSLQIEKQMSPQSFQIE